MQTTKQQAMQTILTTLDDYHFSSIIIRGEKVTYTIDRLEYNISYMIARDAGEGYNPTDFNDVKSFVVSGLAKKLIMK